MKPNKDNIFTPGAVEVRTAEDGSRYVFGYAALYNARSRVMTTMKGRQFVEVIAPGAFDGADLSDVRCQFEHQEFLAAAPTLQVGTDGRGLWYRYQHDEKDPSHVQMLRRIERGDCSGSSFMFPVTGTVEEVSEEAGLTLRSIRSFKKILDVAPVITPAYPDTSVFARSLDADMAEPAATPVPVIVCGIPVLLENALGTIRSGTAPDGKAWEVKMRANYGSVAKSTGADGDKLDIYWTDGAEAARVAFIIDQVNLDGSFDELKCVVGVEDHYDAKRLYLSHFPPGWRGLGAISIVPIDCFVAWALDKKPKNKPILYDPMSAYLSVMTRSGSEAEAGESGTEATGTNPEPDGTKPELPEVPAEVTGSEPEVPAEVAGGETELTGGSAEADGTEAEAARSHSEAKMAERMAEIAKIKQNFLNL